MIVTTKRIEYKYGQTFKLKPIADVHLGARACDQKAFKAYLADSDEDTYFIGIGDLYDGISVKDKRYDISSDGMDGDDTLDQQIDLGCKLLEPYKDRLLGLAVGNHERTNIRGGTNMIKRTCRRLGVENLGYSGLLKLVFSENGSRGRTVVLRYHHGWGGGSRTLGADLTKFSRDIAYWDANIFLYGHVHRRQTASQPRLSIKGEELIARDTVLCICGTFLKTYMDSTDATYSEVCGYPPVSVGGLTVSIKPTDDWVSIKVQ